MKKLLYILFLFIVILLNSCFLGKSKGGTTLAKLPDSDNTKDSISVVLDSLEDIHHVILTSSNDYMTENYSLVGASSIHSSESIRIIEIKNTRVINQSSDLSEGRVVYKIPDRMKIRSTYKVLVRISKSKSVVSIYDSLKGTVRTSTIPITQTMEVVLVDPSPDDKKSFEIVKDNNAVQIIENGDTYTEWSWNVTPIRVGNSNLKIVISIIRDGNKKDIVYEDSVMVEKDIITQIMFFFSKYWQWIIGTLIVPFVVWLYKKRQDKKNTKKKTKKTT